MIYARRSISSLLLALTGLAFFGGLQAYADTPTTSQDVTQEVDKVTTEVLSRLDAIAAKLGVAAGQVWKMYLQQAEVVVYFNAIEMTLMLMVIVVGALNTRRYWAFCNEFDRHGDNTGYFICGIVGHCLQFIFTVVLFVKGYELLTCLLNPGYWAFQQILAQLQGNNN
jgi:hypothetical protein